MDSQYKLVGTVMGSGLVSACDVYRSLYCLSAIDQLTSVAGLKLVLTFHGSGAHRWWLLFPLIGTAKASVVFPSRENLVKPVLISAGPLDLRGLAQRPFSPHI